MADVEPTSRHFCLDEHLPNLLAFPLRSVSLPKLQPFTDARLIAQDKASCMPAYLLLADAGPAGEVTVIDATSAPGNKTSYVSARLHANASAQVRFRAFCNSPGRLRLAQVFACERDPTRFQTLTKMLKKSHCKSKQQGVDCSQMLKHLVCRCAACAYRLSAD